MKTKVMTTVLIVFLSMNVFCQDNQNTEKEKESIKAVIEGLLKDHSECDHEGWISAWTQQPYIFISYTDKSGHFISKGWNELKEMAKNSFTRHMEEDKKSGRFLTLEPYDFTIRVYSESAWAQYKIKWTERYKGKEGIKEWTTFENYSFEKVDDEWKIASISAVDLTSFEEQKEQE
ncbi:MAG: hypothetical protein JW973_01455 [Bacteroidales bacterium]|nr:hypothetical protein [Bacteroidales bacterium]